MNGDMAVAEAGQKSARVERVEGLHEVVVIGLPVLRASSR